MGIIIVLSLLIFCFFDDGTFVRSFFFKEGLSDIEISQNFKKSLSKGNQKNINEPNWGIWGIYRIKGDTIIAQYLIQAGRLIPSDFTEEWFQVIDKKTLKIIKKVPLLKKDIDYYGVNMYADGIENCSPVRFINADSLPLPNCWLKEEKWLWKDESDWVKYMESIKTKKKKKEKL